MVKTKDGRKMTTFPEALDLFAKHIKTSLLIMFINLVLYFIVYGVSLLLGPFVALIATELYNIVSMYVYCMAFGRELDGGEVDLTSIMNYYKDGFSKLSPLIKACVKPLVKMVCFAIVLVLALMAGLSSSLGLFVLLFLTLSPVTIYMVFNYSVEMMNNICCICLDRNDFAYSHDAKCPISRLFWLIIPVVGDITLNLALVKESKEYYNS